MGTVALKLPRHPAVRALGFRPEAEKHDAIAGATALVMPSPHESFSFVILEAWSQGTPVLATARSPVLRGHVERSGAGLLYDRAPGDFAAGRRVAARRRGPPQDARRARPDLRRGALPLAGHHAPVSRLRRAGLRRRRGVSRPGGGAARAADGRPADGRAGVHRALRPRGHALVVPLEAHPGPLAAAALRRPRRPGPRRGVRGGRHAGGPRPAGHLGRRRRRPGRARGSPGGAGSRASPGAGPRRCPSARARSRRASASISSTTGTCVSESGVLRECHRVLRAGRRAARDRLGLQVAPLGARRGGARRPPLHAARARRASPGRGLHAGPRLLRLLPRLPGGGGRPPRAARRRRAARTCSRCPAR